MKNRRNLTILFILFAFVSSWSCSFLTSIGSSHTDTPAEDSSVIEPGGSDDESVAQIVEGPVAPPEIIFPTLGSIAFDVDASATTSAEFIPGRETVLELTDSAGLTWTLTLPMNALDTPQSLKMTALSNVRSQDVPGSLLGGLLLEPDGLEFYAPAILSVTGASSQPFLLTGRHDGTGVEIAHMEDAAGVASIYHFSTIFLSEADQQKAMDEMYKQLNDSEKALTQEAKALLKDQNINVPTPPSTPVECTGEDEAKANEKLIEEYTRAVYEPEGALISKLLSIKRGKALLGREYDETFTLENRLMSRLVKKVRLLIKTYNGQEEKLVAVARVALRVAKSVALLSTNAGYEDKTLFFEEISSWAASLIDKMLEAIRTEHDYRKADAVWKLAYWANLLGNQSKTVEEIQAKLERVFQFEMKLALDIGIVGESEYKLEGEEFPMRYSAQKTQWGMLTGSGPANMTSSEFTSDEDWFVESAPFHVYAIITNFDVCASTAYLTINRFYPDVENHFTRDSEGQVMEIGEMLLMKIAWETLFDDRKKVGLSWLGDGEAMDQYTFQLKLRNKDVIAVDDTIESIDAQSGGTLQGKFKVELTHTPK